MATLILIRVLLYIIPTVTNNKEVNIHETIIENEITTTTTVIYNQIIGTRLPQQWYLVFVIRNVAGGGGCNWAQCTQHKSGCTRNLQNTKHANDDQSAKTRATSYRQHVFLLLEPPWLERTRFQRDRQCTCTRNIEEPVRNHCGRGKAINVTYSERVFVALFIRHVMRMTHITLSSVACLVLPLFPHYPINGRIFGEKSVERQIHVLILSTISVWKTVPF